MPDPRDSQVLLQESKRTPQENLVRLLADGACKLYVCPLCLDTSTNAVPCYGPEHGPAHPDADVVRVGPWTDAAND